MPEVQIRPAVATDLPTLMKMDHSCTSDYVWQMDPILSEGQSGATFREIRLPRSVTVTYPRPVESLADEWNRRAGILVAVIGSELGGYLRLSDQVLPKSAWIMDLAVETRLRRSGIGLALVLAAQKWAKERGDRQIMMEMTSKNYAAIRLSQKLGFEFCGYNDHYYLTQDIALFFGRAL
jgi:ribosomal protein S18 acetylase RimI-like enzyme